MGITLQVGRLLLENGHQFCHFLVVQEINQPRCRDVDVFIIDNKDDE